MAVSPTDQAMDILTKATMFANKAKFLRDLEPRLFGYQPVIIEKTIAADIQVAEWCRDIIAEATRVGCIALAERLEQNSRELALEAARVLCTEQAVITNCILHDNSEEPCTPQKKS